MKTGNRPLKPKIRPAPIRRRNTSGSRDLIQPEQLPIWTCKVASRGFTLLYINLNCAAGSNIETPSFKRQNEKRNTKQNKTKHTNMNKRALMRST